MNMAYRDGIQFSLNILSSFKKDIEKNINVYKKYGLTKDLEIAGEKVSLINKIIDEITSKSEELLPSLEDEVKMMNDDLKIYKRVRKFK